MKEIDTPELILLNIGYAIHHADWNYKNIISPFARIYLVKEGAAKLHLPDSRIQELTPNHLYLIPPFTLHSYECDNYYTLYYIHIYENETSNQRVLEDYLYPVQIDSTQLDDLLIKELVEMNPGRELKQYDPLAYDNTPHLIESINLHSQNPKYSILKTKGILLQLLARFLKYSTDKYEITDSRIMKVLRYIHKNIDLDIKIVEMSSMCYLSKDHFIRLFKKEMGITPVQYINHKKIQKAQLLLITSNKSIKDIAYSLSYENVYYFNRLFRKLTQTTPVEYRKRL